MQMAVEKSGQRALERAEGQRDLLQTISLLLLDARRNQLCIEALGTRQDQGVFSPCLVKGERG